MAAPTTSGTYNYNQTVSKLLAGSLRLCGVIADQETPDAAMAENAMDTLSAMVKGWQASGIRVWAQQECILFLQPGQPQYGIGPASTDQACLFDELSQSTLSATAAAGASTVTVLSSAGMLAGDQFGVQLDAGRNFWTTLAAAPAGNVLTLTAPLPSQATSGAIVFDYTTPLVRPLRVPFGRRYQYSSRIETPLITLSRLDYDYLPDKFNTGTPTQFFYDPQEGNGAYATPLGLVNMWPAPVDNTCAMRFVAQRPLQDIGGLSNILDFPAEWLAALRWNLAVEMGARIRRAR